MHACGMHAFQQTDVIKGDMKSAPEREVILLLLTMSAPSEVRPVTFTPPASCACPALSTWRQPRHCSGARLLTGLFARLSHLSCVQLAAQAVSCMVLLERSRRISRVQEPRFPTWDAPLIVINWLPGL